MNKEVRIRLDKKFQEALPILDIFEKNGFEAYFVGGSVRDALLGKPINDIDIATSAFPEEVKSIFKKTIDVGIQHGTVVVLFHSEPYEVTTFRTESGYQDYRRPDEVTFVRSLEEDLKRRDFTINAFAMDQKGVIKDFFQGLTDLDDKVIRAVGDPFERFSEDALRIMRAIRFQSQLNFEIEKETFQAIVESAPLLSKIAVERIHIEFVKLMLGSAMAKALLNFIEADLYSYCPGLAQSEEDLRNLAAFPLRVKNEVQIWTLLGYYLNLSGQDLGRFMKKWKSSNEIMKQSKKTLQALYDRIDQNGWRALNLYQSGQQAVEDAEYLVSGLQDSHDMDLARQLYTELPIKSKDDMAINGHNLIELSSRRPGKWVGDLLDDLEEKILLSELENNRDVLIAYSRRHIEQLNK